jgi:hypothetical protein
LDFWHKLASAKVGIGVAVSGVMENPILVLERYAHL